MNNKKIAALVASAALTIFAAGCGTDNSNNANNSNATSNANNANGANRNGVVETTPMPANANNKTVDSKTGVVQNDNGNANTAGVRTMDNKNAANGNANKGANANHP